MMGWHLRWAALARRSLVVALLASLTACGSFYVDGAMKEADASRFRKAEPPHPAQVLFEFQTKGVANARATDALRSKVVEQVRASGIFSAVSDAPSAGSGLLSITVNNVPTDDQAFSKGFVTGLTFGLVGTQVSDGYVCVARYTPSGDTQAVQKQARHLIHTTLGASGPPPNSIKAPNLTEAVYTMLRQIVGNVLNDVSNDPAFR